MADIFVSTSGSDTTGDGSSGNPYATPGKAMGVSSSGDRVCVKSGTYAITGTTPNVAGGPVDVLTGRRLEGYAVTPGDLGTAPTITAGAQISTYLVRYTNTYNSTVAIVCNINVDGLGNSTITGFLDNCNHVRAVVMCTASNCTIGFNLTGIEGVSTWAVGCRAISCGKGFYALGRATHCVACWAKDCTTHGFHLAGGHCVACIASGTTAGYGFQGSYGDVFTNCVADRCSSHGFYFTEHNIHLFANCVATNNGGYGFSVPFANYPAVKCGGYNNASGNFSNAPTALSPITLTADPWTSTTDFKPNATAGGGAVLRAAGFGVFGQTGYGDIGAVQHQDAGGGGTPRVIPSGTRRAGAA